MKKQEFITMDYDELDALILKTYGHKYEFVAYEELSNDAMKAFKLMVKQPLNEFEQKDLDKFKATGQIESWRTHILLTDMVNTGVLEPGDYLISVWW